MNSKYFKQKKKVCHIEKSKIEYISYRDLDLLKKFINNNEKINASRITGTKPKFQRQVAQAIKRARIMGLLAYAK